MLVSALLVATAMMFQTNVDATGTAIAKPIGNAILEPTTGHHFQMFEFYGRPPHTWEHAQRMVRGYIYKGKEGRLAFVKTGAIHYFLLLNFLELHSNKAWIGLGTECNETAEIKWLDGSSLSDQSFRAWDEGALRNISRTCRASKLSGKIMPVYYDSHELGLRWDSGNERTNLKYMVVEFAQSPEEREAEETAKAAAAAQEEIDKRLAAEKAEQEEAAKKANEEAVEKNADGNSSN